MARVGATVVMAALLLAVAQAYKVYPTVMPQPSTFSQTAPGGAKVLVTNPGALPVKVAASSSTATVSEETILLVNMAARRGLLAAMAGIDSTTLHWLVVRLPPIRNSSNPADAFPVHTGFAQDVAVHVDDLTAITAADLWNVDESYTISIPAPARFGDGIRITVTAKTFVGVCHAFQTLSQLIVWDGTTFVLPNLPISITDVPRFRWRGLLLDTARHYYPVSAIRHVIDGLAMHRMNVLHWHIVDAQSFPFQSTTYPDLSGKGAFHPDLIYTHADVQSLVQYAFERGVRIVPEFDLPGHDASWGFGYPFLTTPCWDYVKTVDSGNLELAINVVSLDPTMTKTVDFVDGLLEEVTALFPDPFLHLGGDEVQPHCWESDPTIAAFMEARNFTAGQLQAWFTRKLLPLVTKHGKRPVFWEEAFESGATANDTDAVVNVWTSLADLPAIHAAGQDALISYGAYLDRQNPADGTHWMFFDTWHDMYSKMITPSVDATSVLGGEASSWSENCDAANVDERVFHRLPPVAERLWSPAAVSNIWDATARMSEFRCKALRRGIRAGPTQPAYCDVAGTTGPSNDDGGSPAFGTAAIVVVTVLTILLAVSLVALVVMYRRVRALRATTVDDSQRLLGNDGSTPAVVAATAPPPAGPTKSAI